MEEELIRKYGFTDEDRTQLANRDGKKKDRLKRNLYEAS